MNGEPRDAILAVSDALTTLNRKPVFDYAAKAVNLPANLRVIYEYDTGVRSAIAMHLEPTQRISLSNNPVLLRRSQDIERLARAFRIAGMPK